MTVSIKPRAPSQIRIRINTYLILSCSAKKHNPKKQYFLLIVAVYENSLSLLKKYLILAVFQFHDKKSLAYLQLAALKRVDGQFILKLSVHYSNIVPLTTANRTENLSSTSRYTCIIICFENNREPKAASHVEQIGWNCNSLHCRLTSRSPFNKLCDAPSC